MQTSLDYKSDFLCVVSEFEVPDGRNSRTLMKEWYPVHPANEAQARALVGRPVAVTDSEEGIYVDEEGNVYQLADKGETKPIAVEHLPGPEKSELEVLLEASLKGGKEHEPNADSKRVHRRMRNNGRKTERAPQVVRASLEPAKPAAPQRAGSKATAAATEAPDESVRLNLRQKLGEVRRRIGYVQKRGYNERHNYNYVAAADIAGTVGDILAELGVVVIPRLESITYEPQHSRTYR